jgi:HTH-type transcriptional regulator / antitoxin HigA
MKKNPLTHDEYLDTMQEIEKYLQKTTQNGSFESLTIDETERLKMLSILAEQYEDSIPMMPLKKPQSLSGMLKLKMVTLNIRQKEMAELLGIAESRLSEVLSGKRRVNMDLAKKLHTILKIEAEFILQTA